MRAGDYFLDLASLQEGDSVFREPTDEGPGWTHLRNPVGIDIARTIGEVEPLIRRADEFRRSGGTAVLAIAYEASSAFESARVTAWPERSILAWSARYEGPAARYRELLPAPRAEIRLQPPAWNLAEYGQAFERVRQALERGESYEVNLTFPQTFSLTCSPEAFFANRCGVDPPPYAAYLHLGDIRLASFSPELFFERRGVDLWTEPMKGTAIAPDRRKDLLESIRRLQEDPKARSENLMIVDMARSDLGAVCEVGSVSTDRLLSVGRHRGLLQATSRVSGRCSAPLWDVLQALFPPASVTGAPKVETMKRITEIEPAPRGFYCGTIGIARPNLDRFSVAIRTAEIDATSNSGKFGIGSGVVWESQLDAEYEECLAKRDRLLVQGILWRLKEAIAVDRVADSTELERHLDRLSDNASFFDVPFDRERLQIEIQSAARNPGRREKLRIWLDRGGSWTIERLPSVVQSNEMRVALAAAPVSSKDVNLRRKTSSRAMLDDALDLACEADDVLFFNEHGHLTEFGYGNVVVEHDGKLFTPHPEDGCLAGIGVQRLIDGGRAIRASVPIEWLDEGGRIFYVNSVAGLIPARLVSSLAGKTPEISPSRE